jgi:hypothetical protein
VKTKPINHLFNLILDNKSYFFNQMIYRFEKSKSQLSESLKEIVVVIMIRLSLKYSGLSLNGVK